MAVTLFGAFAFLLLFNIPIAFCLGLAAAIGMYFMGGPDLLVIPQKMFTSINSFTLMAIPFFMLAGSLMQNGGISTRLIKMAKNVVGSMTGGLAIIAVVTSMFFAAISGSSPSTVAAMGSILIPAMIKEGYGEGFAGAVQAASGSLGVIIPPSITMITYGVVTGTSIGDLFLGGFGAGLLYGGIIIFVAYVISKIKGYKGTEKASFKEFIESFKDAIWAILMPVIILGGIYGGIFTPTEAAAVAVLYGFVIGMFVYKDLKIEDIPDVFMDSAKSTSVVMLIIATATIFGWLLNIEQIPTQIANAVLNFSTNPIIVLLLINVLLLFVGCFIETNAAIIILAPILLPLALKIGIDPIHFGVIMVVNTAMGMITPPLGVNLFVACGISKISMENISKAAIPFMLALIVATLLITFIPSISMFLPSLF